MNTDPVPYQWALPESLEVPSDPLEIRLDFHHDAIVMYTLDTGTITTRIVSAIDICQALVRDVPFSSGLLPPEALWWSTSSNGPAVALWRNPQTRKVALLTKALKEPLRFVLPMPGLIFICASGRPPAVYAARRRPVSPDEHVYHAPLFNVFQNGQTCPGNHTYPASISDIPESFFRSFFSTEGHSQGRSQEHPDNLLDLWKEIDGKKRFPVSDLVEFGTVKDLIHATGRIPG